MYRCRTGLPGLGRGDSRDAQRRALSARCDRQRLRLPNDVAGPDYTGELGLELSLRLTDRRNAYTPGGETDQGTVEDVTLPATISCLPTAGASTGATCALNTTANTLIPGAVTFGARAIWELGHVKVNDAGPDGLVSTADGVTPFAVQGVFTP